MVWVKLDFSKGKKCYSSSTVFSKQVGTEVVYVHLQLYVGA